jgi:hypothetical protein
VKQLKRISTFQPKRVEVISISQGSTKDIQIKQGQMQWLQDPNEINGDNLKTVICEASRHLFYSFRRLKN